MISMLICRCPNAPTKAYKFLEPIVENWMDIPVYNGMKECNEFLEKLQAYFEEDISHEVSNFILKSSKYIIVVGWNKEKFEWVDIAHGKNKEEAEIIVREFA